MNHKIFAGIAIIFLCSGLTAFRHIVASTPSANTYYINPSIGKEGNTGTREEPFLNLEQVSLLRLNPGDSILLAAGTVVHGSLILRNVRGTEKLPVVITSYQEQKNRVRHATIDAKGYGMGVLLENCNHVRIEKLLITADGGGLTNVSEKAGMRCGVLVKTSEPGTFGDITLSHLSIKNVFFEEEGFQRGAKEVHSANGTQRYGWGIRFMSETEGALLKNLRVEDCEVRNVSHTGIKFTGQKQNIRNVTVRGNKIVETGGPGLQFSNVINGSVNDNYISHSGSNSDSRKWGRGSGLWTWSCTDFVIEYNQFLHANGPGDSAGCHIDYNCRDIIVQYNLSANNAGGFIEILGNNHNCAYRYNISVNDGFRVKGKNGAFQEGEVLWTSGFVGKEKKKIGPFNSYIYNNTIYVKEESRSCFSISPTTLGLLIANNIFHIPGETVNVSGDQDTRSEDEGRTAENVVLINNLYIQGDVIPTSLAVRDSKPLIGDPEFERPGITDARGYLPHAVDLIRDKGIYIDKLPGDSIGLRTGLDVRKDYFGNPVKGKPDMGAIELQQ